MCVCVCVCVCVVFFGGVQAELNAGLREEIAALTTSSATKKAKVDAEKVRVSVSLS